jgi:hypothetical protein
MSIRIASFAALAALALALPSQARAPEPQQATLILAQSRGEASCEMDGRRVPQGTRVCFDGQQMTCSARGRWEKTGKAC